MVCSILIQKSVDNNTLVFVFLSVFIGLHALFIVYFLFCWRQSLAIRKEIWAPKGLRQSVATRAVEWNLGLSILICVVSIISLLGHAKWGIKFITSLWVS